jgi:hypothetical protein
MFPDWWKRRIWAGVIAGIIAMMTMPDTRMWFGLLVVSAIIIALVLRIRENRATNDLTVGILGRSSKGKNVSRGLGSG